MHPLNSSAYLNFLSLTLLYSTLLYSNRILIKKAIQNKHQTDIKDQHSHSLKPIYTRLYLLTHFSPGISNKLVSPVQLMSSFYDTD